MKRVLFAVGKALFYFMIYFAVQLLYSVILFRTHIIANNGLASKHDANNKIYNFDCVMVYNPNEYNFTITKVATPVVANNGKGVVLARDGCCANG